VHGFPLTDSPYQAFLEIRASDSGIGITSDNMKRLFHPFMQIDSALSRKYQGTGLGLAMVRQMAELHGGTVAVSSAVGEGSRFAAWLPIRDAGIPGETGQVRPVPSVFGLLDAAPTGPQGPVALVVDDDDKAADLIRLLLEAEGMRVVRAASAEDAMRMAPQQALSLITLAIELPGMNGWDFLEKIRKLPKLGSVPVVVVAAQDCGEMALSRGAAAVLQKPVSRDQLRELLDDLGLNPAAERTHTVLIVDDDPKAVEVIAAFLEGPAYHTVRAYGGRQAISLARQLHPDLILLDLMMPEVSGFDVVAELGRSPGTADIPILVVTAKEITVEDRTALSRNGSAVVRTLEKAGFDQARFMAEVRRALSSPTSQN
jgi:CheY-like chemotaxis protein